MRRELRAPPKRTRLAQRADAVSSECTFVPCADPISLRLLEASERLPLEFDERQRYYTRRKQERLAALEADSVRPGVCSREDPGPGCSPFRPGHSCPRGLGARCRACLGWCKGPHAAHEPSLSPPRDVLRRRRRSSRLFPPPSSPGNGQSWKGRRNRPSSGWSAWRFRSRREPRSAWRWRAGKLPRSWTLLPSSTHARCASVGCAFVPGHGDCEV